MDDAFIFLLFFIAILMLVAIVALAYRMALICADAIGIWHLDRTFKRIEAELKMYPTLSAIQRFEAREHITAMLVVGRDYAAGEPTE